jgi:hypothetical protein
MDEEWKLIEGYDYFVSTHGNIENAKTGELLKPSIATTGYYYVGLCKNGKVKKISNHRLVAEAFIDNPYNKQYVDHVNNDKLDNSVENLRWATNQENGRNATLSSKNTSGIKGVCWYKPYSKWCARIMINGKNKNIGYYTSIEEAKKARQEYANEIFGEYTNKCEKV